MFKINLYGTTQNETIENAISFVGEDQSGSFGIMSNHARMMTCLKFGLAYFRNEKNEVEYLAFPGAVVYFVNNNLHISTRHYFRDKNYHEIIAKLEQQLLVEEQNISSIKGTLHRLDEMTFRRLWELEREMKS